MRSATLRANSPSNRGSSVLSRLLVFTLIFILILNPYTIFGRPGIAVALAIALYSIAKIGYTHTLKDFSRPLFAMLFIGTWGALVSQFNGIGQFNHPLGVTSLAVILLTACGIWKICKDCNIDSYSLISMLMYSIALNSLIVILEVNEPALRASIESYLIPAGNINWEEGFRYRGLSASGGAGLSICTPVAFACLLYLYENNRISLTMAIAVSLTLLMAVLNIGRTGLFLTSIVLLFYISFYSKKIFSDPSRAIKSTILILGIAALITYNYELIINYLTDKFGAGFTRYAFEFALEGSKGLESEGTVETIISFLSVLPTGFPEALTGYGFYGGSEFYPWTDSGYARMFLSVGFILGTLFYFLIYLIYIKTIKSHKFLLYCIALILIIAETKEPLLYSGNASRMFIMILIFSHMDHKISKQSGRV